MVLSFWLINRLCHANIFFERYVASVEDNHTKEKDGWKIRETICFLTSLKLTSCQNLTLAKDI